MQIPKPRIFLVTATGLCGTRQDYAGLGSTSGTLILSSSSGGTRLYVGNIYLQFGILDRLLCYTRDKEYFKYILFTEHVFL